MAPAAARYCFHLSLSLSLSNSLSIYPSLPFSPSDLHPLCFRLWLTTVDARSSEARKTLGSHRGFRQNAGEWVSRRSYSPERCCVTVGRTSVVVLLVSSSVQSAAGCVHHVESALCVWESERLRPCQAVLATLATEPRKPPRFCHWLSKAVSLLSAVWRYRCSSCCCCGAQYYRHQCHRSQGRLS
jgi:hypothetical protein